MRSCNDKGSVLREDYIDKLGEKRLDRLNKNMEIKQNKIRQSEQKI